MPCSKRHLQENEFIWWAVNHRSLAVPNHLQSLLHPLPTVPEATAFALAVPSKLAAFLQQVSLPDMRRAMVDMLADAYRSETPDCMLDLRNRLEPTVWHEMTAALNGQLGITRRSEVACVLLDLVMESYHPDDGWTIQVTTALSGPPALPFLGGVVLHSMYQDWMLYLRYIRNSRHAWNTMQKLTHQGRQAQVWERVRAILFCASLQQSYVSMLPAQIIESVLIPWLLFIEASGGRKEPIESLTTRESHIFVQ
ncbi:hypothetical protein FGB62_37g120 [Gracilaria domingensis]|nr:hypothetical protein FGB62_37g120 [Gracilaria domingensis]